MSIISISAPILEKYLQELYGNDIHVKLNTLPERDALGIDVFVDFTCTKQDLIERRIEGKISNGWDFVKLADNRVRVTKHMGCIVTREMLEDRMLVVVYDITNVSNKLMGKY